MDAKRPGLELGRFIAALIVTLGHLFFVESKVTNWSNDQIILGIFKHGEESVSFFFMLSGFVLAPHSKFVLKSPLVWLQSRLVRLMPIYYLTYLVPLFGYIVLTKQSPNGLIGVILSILGVQSLNKAHYIDLPNPPLWSLSVELMLSITFIILFRLKSIKLLIVAFIAYVTNKYLLNGPFIDGMCYFCIGLSLNNHKLIKKFNKLLIRFITLIMVIILLPGFSNHYLNFVDQKFQKMIALSLILLVLNSWNIYGNIARICNLLGERTYALYACHFPILVFINLGFLKEKEIRFPWLYIIVMLIIIWTITELTYRFVEVPSIKISRQIRRKILVNDLK